MTTYHIGKDYDAPIAIEDRAASVSHDHASITIDNDIWTLNDHNSTNGTYIEIDGIFRRCNQITIKPSTWIRLGEAGHRGHYFKARRVIHPNDYREDFAELYDKYQELEDTKKKLEENRQFAKFIPLSLMVIAWIVTMLPIFEHNNMLLRICFFIPGALSPFIQDMLSKKLNNKVKTLQTQLICPKCRRTLSKDDILNRSHPYCKAY